MLNQLSKYHEQVQVFTATAGTPEYLDLTDLEPGVYRVAFQCLAGTGRFYMAYGSGSARQGFRRVDESGAAGASEGSFDFARSDQVNFGLEADRVTGTTFSLRTQIFKIL